MSNELSNGMRKKLKGAFRNYSGRINKAQKRVLDALDVTYGTSNGGHIYFEYEGRRVVSSASPSDWRTGRNLSSHLVKLIQG